MSAFKTQLCVKLLGRPEFLLNTVPVEMPSRKAAALCIYLAALATRKVERTHLSGLLWSSVDESAARTSLRKALSILGNDPATTAIVGRDRAFAWFDGDPLRTDLAAFHDLVARGSERAYREAMGLWAGEPLEGVEIGEPLFDDWVGQFRRDTTAFSHRVLSERLGAFEPHSEGPQHEIALCELILAIEPTDAPATERLMGLYCAEANIPAAARCYRTFTNALRELEVPIPLSIADFARNLGLGDGSPAALPNTTPDFGIPSVRIQRPAGLSPAPDAFSYAHSEVMCQLTRFRSIKSFEPLADADGADHKVTISVDDPGRYDYRLLLWNEPNARALYLRCINNQRQETVSCVRLGYDVLRDRSRAETVIANAINTIERDILSDEGRAQTTPFARWLLAFREMQTFTPDADKAALAILDDLSRDPAGSRLSLVHSAIGSVYLKQRLYDPSAVLTDQGIVEAAPRIRRALTLDPYEPFNHVMAGWLAIQLGEHERAIGAFDNAIALNPYSSRTMISAAQAYAYCGEPDRARILAKRARELSGAYTPSYIQGYLASIAYIAGDLDECVRRLPRAPDNVHTILLSMAAYEEKGDTSKLRAAQIRFDRALRQAEPFRNVDATALSRWVITATMMKEGAARHRLLRSLERAGVPVVRQLA
ncbi:MAG: hypothetical protein AAF318_12100 [Pseudomonadota bacterium]